MARHLGKQKQGRMAGPVLETFANRAYIAANQGGAAGHRRRRRGKRKR
jgi:hypothetical protein